VFSHSLACNVAMWEPQVKAFSELYNVLCYDTRGHGQSSAPKVRTPWINCR
jgi:3-oxoadipate enol-lactonase